MKRSLCILILLSFFSCKCDVETYYLNDVEIELLPYENTNSVTFIDNSENLVVFENIYYGREIYEESSPPAFFYTGNCHDKFEEINVSLSSTDNYDISMLTEGGGITMTITNYDFDGSRSYFYLTNFEYVNSFSFNGIIYDEVLRVYNPYSISEAIIIKNTGLVKIRFGHSEAIQELILMDI